MLHLCARRMLGAGCLAIGYVTFLTGCTSTSQVGAALGRGDPHYPAAQHHVAKSVEPTSPAAQGPAPPSFSRTAIQPTAGVGDQIVAQAGNHPSRTNAVPAPVVLKGVEIEWAIQTPDTSPGVVRSGKNLVGPDGVVVVGPYGPVSVAGLTLEQASMAIEKHVAPYVKTPKVAVMVPDRRYEAPANNLPKAHPAAPAPAISDTAVIAQAQPLPSKFQPTNAPQIGPKARPLPQTVPSTAQGMTPSNTAPIPNLPAAGNDFLVFKSADGKKPVLIPFPSGATQPSAQTPLPQAGPELGSPAVGVMGRPATLAQAPAPRAEPPVRPTLFQMPPVKDPLDAGTKGKGGKDSKDDKTKEDDNGPAKVMPGAGVGAPAGPYVGMPYGHMVGTPTELNRAVLPPYIIGPSDVLQIESLRGLLEQPVRGPHVVRPDSTVGIGVYGSVLVAGMTLDQAREAIARTIHARLNPKVFKLQDVYDGVSVDVLAYNSKVYYVIFDGAGLGYNVERLPFTGNETVLDALALMKGLPPQSTKKKIWVARRCPGPDGRQILPVDWDAITKCGETSTNHQILPGDRVYVAADRVRTFSNNLDKMLHPIERLFGATLLGSQTVNSIRNGTTGFGNGLR